MLDAIRTKLDNEALDCSVVGLLVAVAVVERRERGNAAYDGRTFPARCPAGRLDVAV